MTPTQTSIVRTIKLGSDLKLRRQFMVIDESVKANIRVGLVLELLDKLAEHTALRYARKSYPDVRVVTAAMDDLEIWAPPDITKDLVLRARINLVGRSSMEVGIRIEQPGETTVHIGTCYFTMVARRLEEDRESSASLPPLEYLRPEEQARAERAMERRKKRQRQKEQALPTSSEYAMLHRLHHEIDRDERPVLMARDLVASGWERTYPEHENVPRKIFGGYVAHRAYMYANICAEMVADQRALLVSSDRIDFYQPVRMGDKLLFTSRVTYTGSNSISVETAITRISRDRTMTALSNNCVFSFVNVDGDLNLLPVPRVYPATYSEDMRYLDGYRRHMANPRHRKSGGEGGTSERLVAYESAMPLTTVATNY